jgi:hypothetical protein
VLLDEQKAISLQSEIGQAAANTKVLFSYQNPIILEGKWAGL